ncbi:3-ketoacyl-CoA synthase 5 [Linum grandiflorum]
MMIATEVSVPMFDRLTSIVDEFSFLFDPKPLALLALFAVALYYTSTSKQIYLVDFVCFKGPKTHRVPISTFVEHAEIGNSTKDTVEFQTKVIERSGIGEQSYLPTGMHFLPPSPSLKYGVEELEMVLFSTVQNLLTKLDVDPTTIDAVITNCSLVSLTPSLAAMVINKFGFRTDVKSYNISGMGCSAGLLSLSLARDMLRVHRNSLVLVVSVEAVSPSIYEGKVKSMLLANCLFRMGGAAVLLSNRETDRRTSKYELKHIVKTNLGSKDTSYKCVFQQTDSEGYNGVALSKSILQIAGEGLKTNLVTLAAMALPYSEIIKYGFSLGRYQPDFKKAFDHFCIHAGGKAVIDAIRKSLKLKDEDVEASKMTLHRFGNTSSSSIWYSLGYLEAKGRIKEGDRVWQIGFGSGFKCNSAVWKCISRTKSDHWNVWSDCIHQYPVEVTDCSSDH